MKFSSTLSLAALFIAGAKATDINECLAAIDGEACATMYGGGVCSEVCFEEYFQAFNCAAECDSTGANCAANGDLEAWLGIADPTDMLELFYKPYMCESPCPVEAIDAYYNCQFVYDWNLGSCAGCDEYYAPLPTMDGFEDCFTAGADFFYVYIEEGMKKCPSVEAYFTEAFGGTCSYDACVDWGEYYGYDYVAAPSTDAPVEAPVEEEEEEADAPVEAPVEEEEEVVEAGPAYETCIANVYSDNSCGAGESAAVNSDDFTLGECTAIEGQAERGVLAQINTWDAETSTLSTSEYSDAECADKTGGTIQIVFDGECYSGWWPGDGSYSAECGVVTEDSPASFTTMAVGAVAFVAMLL